MNSHSDSDGDGSPDLNEFIAGTDPTNKFSFFALAGVNASSTSGFIVQWNSVSNKYYTVGRATNGLVVGFVPVATNIPATFPVNTYTDSVGGAGSAFYRIAVWK